MGQVREHRLVSRLRAQNYMFSAPARHWALVARRASNHKSGEIAEFRVVRTATIPCIYAVHKSTLPSLQTKKNMMRAESPALVPRINAPAADNTPTRGRPEGRSMPIEYVAIKEIWRKKSPDQSRVGLFSSLMPNGRWAIVGPESENNRRTN